eukprot:CAMPEP_0114575446 /NCGR_PEP_ID=MMETSP0125-20121206/315_1 /TAXON_ID=485358 ORGANISM="Aristerostoma sp., Strain ATCC 50986" /NCGR_SAMPLE_ID=MMETSP0125 /ASSEMBLY_ACC=CAM_ASM_000245 /LENGTH=89 /DNA_ID=CAMNT_0001763183 /DNA_START=235 /DNA_END=504 /DNA_ORIENTATION=+
MADWFPAGSSTSINSLSSNLKVRSLLFELEGEMRLASSLVLLVGLFTLSKTLTGTLGGIPDLVDPVVVFPFPVAFLSSSMRASKIFWVM